jgi:hypothetical protein
MSSIPDLETEVKTFCFAPEIERSLVSILWQHPQFFELAARELDFAVHITSPPLRRILEALELVINEPGIGIDADWPCVVSAIRELCALEECGGLDGLNTVFTDGGFYPSGRHEFRHGAEDILREYIRALKVYAVNRQSLPEERPPAYTGGKGYLKPNKVRRNERSPAFTGMVRVRGVKYRISAWEQPETQSYSLSLVPVEGA